MVAVVANPLVSLRLLVKVNLTLDAPFAFVDLITELICPANKPALDVMVIVELLAIGWTAVSENFKVKLITSPRSSAKEGSEAD